MNIYFDSVTADLSNVRVEKGGQSIGVYETGEVWSLCKFMIYL